MSVIHKMITWTDIYLGHMWNLDRLIIDRVVNIEIPYRFTFEFKCMIVKKMAHPSQKSLYLLHHPKDRCFLTISYLADPRADISSARRTFSSVSSCLRFE
jgi:hypothetical protein